MDRKKSVSVCSGAVRTYICPCCPQRSRVAPRDRDAQQSHAGWWMDLGPRGGKHAVLLAVWREMLLVMRGTHRDIYSWLCVVCDFVFEEVGWFHFQDFQDSIQSVSVSQSVSQYVPHNNIIRNEDRSLWGHNNGEKERRIRHCPMGTPCKWLLIPLQLPCLFFFSIFCSCWLFVIYDGVGTYDEMIIMDWVFGLLMMM